MKSCVLKLYRYTRHVKLALPVAIGGVVILSGCQFPRELDWLHVVYRNPRTPAPTDVTTPGHPVAQSPTPSRVTANSTNATRTTTSNTKPSSSAKPNAAPPAKSQTAAVQFPTAKAVPDRPGYVYSPSDPTKYVDVTGYAPGSKVKDPYSGKIFLVP